MREKLEIQFGSYATLSENDDLHSPESWKILENSQYEINNKKKPSADFLSRLLLLEELTPTTNINWIRLKELSTGEFRWLPLQVAFLGAGISDKGTQDEIAISEPISTGMACGQTLNDATLSGIYEVVERDAIMGMWINRINSPRVDFSAQTIESSRLRRILKDLDRTEYKIIVNDLTSDFGIPVYFATLLYDDVPYTIVGAGCHHNPEIAIEKALLEIMMALSVFAQQDISAEEISADYEIADMHDHAKIYMFNDLRSRLDFLNNKYVTKIRQQQWRASSNDEILKFVVKIISENGYKLYVNDLTTPEVQDLGLFVVKVVIPELLPLNNLHNNTPNGAARVKRFNQIFGSKNHLDSELNPWPHPFP